MQIWINYNEISLFTHACSLAMKHHPDRKTDPKDKEVAKQKFQEISQAYNILRDRKYYKAAKKQCIILVTYTTSLQLKSVNYMIKAPTYRAIYN